MLTLRTLVVKNKIKNGLKVKPENTWAMEVKREKYSRPQNSFVQNMINYTQKLDIQS